MFLRHLILLFVIVSVFSSCTFLNVFSSYNPEIVTMSQAKNIRGNEIISIGDNKNEVIKKWGNPKHKYMSLDRDSYSEMWIYTNRTEIFQKGVTAFQLYFNEGDLTKIEQYLW